MEIRKRTHKATPAASYMVRKNPHKVPLPARCPPGARHSYGTEHSPLLTHGAGRRYMPHNLVVRSSADCARGPGRQSAVAL